MRRTTRVSRAGFATATVLVATAVVAGGLPAQADAAHPRPDRRAADGATREPRVSGNGAAPAPRVLSSRPGHPLARPAGIAADASAADVASAFARSRATDLNLRGTVRAASTRRSLAGGDIVRLQQVVDGVPVLGGEVVVDLDAQGRTRSAISRTLVGVAPGSVPRLDRSRATAAITQIAAASLRPHELGSGLHVSQPSLSVYDPVLLGAPAAAGSSQPRLVWRAEVVSPQDLSVRRLVMIDAASGKPVANLDLLQHALDRVVCDRANVRASSAQVSCSRAAAVRVEGEAPVNSPVDVDQAYDNAKLTYDFFRDRLGRDSVDGLGLTLRSTVRWCPSSSSGEECPYPNAFWNGAQMVYGEGYAAADDVVAHELTHGITQYTSGLFYYFQSGAINESISDIFGEFVDLTDHAADAADDASPATRWLMGEDLADGAVRDMADPAAFGQPDTTQSPRYLANLPAGPDFDSGAVHTNSGVGNRFASLLVDGGSLSGVPVPAMTGTNDETITRAATIVFEATRRMTSATDYRGFAAALRAACSALIGTASISALDCAGVDSAVRAVRMDEPPASAPTPRAPVCAAGEVTATRYADTLDDPSRVTWKAGGTRVPASIEPGNWPLWYYGAQSNVYGQPQRYATSGTNNLWGDDPGLGFVSSHTMTMKSAVRVSGTTFFRFDHAFGFQADNQRNYDGGVVEYSTDNGATWSDAGPLMRGASDNGYGFNVGGRANSVLAKVRGGNPLGGRAAFTGQSQGYVTSRVNLTSLSGRYVKLRFRIGTDAEIGDYGWFIDNVSIYSCMALLTMSRPRAVVDAPTYLTWTANDRTARTSTTYRLATARFGQPLSAYGPVLSAPRTRALRVTPPAAGTTCVWMTSRDLDSLRTSQATRCLTLPVDDRRLLASAGWSRQRVRQAHAGTLRVATAKGATLRLAGAHGTRVTILARTARGGGVAGVFVHGRKVATLSLASRHPRSTQRTVVVSGVHGTVTIKVLSAGRPVAIDGVAVRP